MLFLSDLRDAFVAIGIADADHAWSGKMLDKKKESIGVYNGRNGNRGHNSVGGSQNSSYELKKVSVLVHWNKDQRITERKSYEIYEKIRDMRNVPAGDTKILFTDMEYVEPVDIGTNDEGIYEMVIDFNLYYERQVLA